VLNVSEAAPSPVATPLTRTSPTPFAIHAMSDATAKCIHTDVVVVSSQ
jgi:hypothetical protein